MTTADEGMTAAQLQERYGAGRRTLTKYAEMGLIDRPTLRGRRTTYAPDQVTRVAAIQALKAQGYLLREMKHALAKLSPQALRALAYPAPPAPAPATARATIAAAPAAAPVIASAASDLLGSPWHRVALLRGLELSVAADATPFVLRIAKEIAERYRTRESLA